QRSRTHQFEQREIRPNPQLQRPRERGVPVEPREVVQRERGGGQSHSRAVYEQRQVLGTQLQGRGHGGRLVGQRAGEIGRPRRQHLPSGRLVGEQLRVERGHERGVVLQLIVILVRVNRRPPAQ